MEFSEKVEAGNLLEEGWFFGNLLNTSTKTRTMSRCYSDPCPPSSYTREMLLVTTKSSGKSSSSSSKKKSQQIPSLMRTPSLPTSMVREELRQEREDGYSLVKKSNSRCNLIREPSLPPCMLGSDKEDEDQESEFTMGRLIRQASLNSSQMSNPRHTAKGMTQSPSIPRHRPRKNPELENIKVEGLKERRSKNTSNEPKIKKSQSEVEFEEIEGFKDLGFSTCEKEKSRVGLDKVKVKRKPYVCAPTIPAAGWVDKSSAEDMKAQIKFWARAVASNVRQEC